MGAMVWVPAFPGNTGEGNKAPYGASRHFPQRGKIKTRPIFPLWGKYPRSGGRGLVPHSSILIDVDANVTVAIERPRPILWWSLSAKTAPSLGSMP